MVTLPIEITSLDILRHILIDPSGGSLFDSHPCLLTPMPAIQKRLEMDPWVTRGTKRIENRGHIDSRAPRPGGLRPQSEVALIQDNAEAFNEVFAEENGDIGCGSWTSHNMLVVPRWNYKKTEIGSSEAHSCQPQMMRVVTLSALPPTFNGNLSQMEQDISPYFVGNVHLIRRSEPSLSSPSPLTRPFAWLSSTADLLHEDASSVWKPVWVFFCSAVGWCDDVQRNNGGNGYTRRFVRLVISMVSHKHNRAMWKHATRNGRALLCVVRRVVLGLLQRPDTEKTGSSI